MNYVVYDIETLKDMFLMSLYDPVEKVMYDIELSQYRLDINSFKELMDKYTSHYWVGYNNLRFDSQVIEYIIRNVDNWESLPGSEISQKIHQKAQDVIDDANYEIAPEYREDHLTFKQIDLFTIWHFNNENRRTSLKAIEFAIDFENIEEMPIDHKKDKLSSVERQQIIAYCHNDVMATHEFYKITRGDTNISIYKGKDKIKDRFIMEEEFGLRCLNWDDVKIGAEWNKMDYLSLTRKSEKDIKPTKINYFFGKRFRQFFPSTTEFVSPKLNKFVKNFGNEFALNKKQEFKYEFNDELIVTLAKGGIHSTEGGRFVKPGEDEIYYQCDIGSQYPNAIRKYKIEPSHLKGWNNLIVSKIDRRLKYKKLYKETGDPKYNSLQEMGKLALNGGSYGRLNTKGDWQEDPMCMLKVTIGCQLEILMIVETLLLKGFRVISCNTDGFDAIVKRDRDEEFKSILTGFEKRIGNDVLGQFEYTEFKWIAQTSVNDYIALKVDGDLKMKGDFEIDKELHKNKSMRIVPIAIREYFVNNTPIEHTIKNHTNIYDFCIRQKASRFFHYEGVNKNTVNIYNKLIRYYVSNSGEKLYKIKNPECTTNAPARAQIEAGLWVCNVRNYLPKDTDPRRMDINYDYYIERTERILKKIDKNYIGARKDKQQLTLW